MNELERQKYILDLVRERQFITVNDLSDLMDASPATIRRDVVKLDQRALLRKVHGGIARIDDEPGIARGKPYRENQVLNVVQKQAIAQAAAQLCHDGDTIFIHAGSTCSLFSRSLTTKSLRVYTNSIAVSENIWRNEHCHLHLLGGDLHREQAVLHSQRAWDEQFFVAKCFMGTLGLGPDGLLENDPLLVRVVEMIAKRASDVIVLADSSKFAMRPRLHALAFSHVSTLVTDDGVTDKDAKMIEDAGVQIVIAPAIG